MLRVACCMLATLSFLFSHSGHGDNDDTTSSSPTLQGRDRRLQPPEVSLPSLSFHFIPSSLPACTYTSCCSLPFPLATMIRATTTTHALQTVAHTTPHQARRLISSSLSLSLSSLDGDDLL